MGNRNESTRGGRPKGRPKTGGRHKGTPNKVTQEVKSVARGMLDSPTYRRRIRKQLLDGTLDVRIEVLLWHYAYGRPSQAIELSGSFDAAAYLASLTPEP